MSDSNNVQVELVQTPSEEDRSDHRARSQK